LESLGSTTTCAGAAGEDISVIFTPSDSPTLTEWLFSCNAGQGVASDIPFGTYTIAVALLNASEQALGNAPAQQVTLSADACDQIIAGDCARNLSVTIVVD
jgi:hypothetical protein